VSLRCSLVFVDKASEDRSALDPLVGEVGDGMVGSWRAQLLSAVRPLPVVVVAYPSSTVRRWRWPRMSIRSVTSDRTVRTNLSAYAFARGLRGGVFTTSMLAPARTASNAVLN
jgi:hypothetical protein